MAGEEPGLTVVDDPIAWLRAAAPWLCAPELETCIVGSGALAIACARHALLGPRPGDLDLAWALGPDAGAALLQRHGVFLPTTDGNIARGTVALKLDGQRIEVTTFRGAGAFANARERIAADLAERDMTIGALAVELASGALHDPHDGLDDWRERCVRPVGDPAQRVHEHPVRWLRYYRKAHELGFAIDPAIRALALSTKVFDALPREAIAGELRAVLMRCGSPGRCLLELHEAGLLQPIAPELALQFDGRPAGPQRHHPEVSQALHLVLALEWAVARTRDLDERDALAVRIAVLCHDLGKGYTPDEELPGHRGHDLAGLPHIARLLDRWPGLADQRSRTLARQVSALHLHMHRFAELRAGTLAGLYDEWLRAGDFPVELFALAIAADAAGRLGLEHTGEAVFARVHADVTWLREACASVDAGELRQRHGDDVAAFRAALHEARARAISRRRGATSPAGEARP